MTIGGRSAGPPLYGIDEAAMRFIEIHETRAHAIGGRVMHDLGDCVLLESPRDREPFFNRVAAVRWPDEPGAFDHRLAEVMSLFAGFDRRPHVWTAPAFSGPTDRGARLAGHGFRDIGGGYVMLLVRPPVDNRPNDPQGVVLERLDGGPGRAVSLETIREIAQVLAESFAAGHDRVDVVAEETVGAFASPAFHVCLARLAGRPVAVGKRYTFDGASYLSSIGTRPGHRGRGLGSFITDHLVRDSLADGSRHVYLGVHAHNDRAISIYRRAGLEILGERSGDYLLV